MNLNNRASAGKNGTYFGFGAMVVTVLLLSFSLGANAQSAAGDIRSNQLLFPTPTTEFNIDYLNNRAVVNDFGKAYSKVTSSSTPYKVVTVGSASPEGGYNRNMKLAAIRSSSVRNYLEREFAVDSLHIAEGLSCIDWAIVVNYLENHEVKNSDAILNIIKTTPDIPDANSAVDRRTRLMESREGRDWEYLMWNVFPLMRSSALFIVVPDNADPSLFDNVFVYPQSAFKQVFLDYGVGLESEKVIAEEAVATIVEEKLVEAEPAKTDEAPIEVAPVVPEPVAEAVVEPTPTVIQPQEDTTIIVRRLAIKTNMLYDVLTCLNISLEFPFADHFSIEAMYMQPWWGNPDKQMNVKPWTIKSIYGEVAFKYWFNKVKTNELIGHNVFVFGGVVNADVRFGGNDYQFDLFSVVGLGYGYNWEVARDWRIGLDLGLGWFRGTYRHGTRTWGIPEGETKERWFILSDGQGLKRLDWIGPVRASVYVTYLIPFKKKVRK